MNKINEFEVFSNDDGWILHESNPPLSLDHLRSKIIDTYKDTGLTTFLWCVGGHEVYDYETKIGERIGDGYKNLDDSTIKRSANLKSLIDDCGGPLTGLSKLCHEVGMKFYPSVRMNEHYDIDINSPRYGRFRRERPDLLIGKPGERFEVGTLEHGIRTGLNFAFAETREHMLSIITELVEDFDVDGIELDWFRHPAFFRVDEAYENRHLATDLIKKVKEKINAVTETTGRIVKLAVRVPPTLQDSARIGLDVEQWIKNEFVDIVIAGGGFIPYSTPIDEFVDVAKNTDIKVLGSLEHLRPAVTERSITGIIDRHIAKGAQGIYFFNYFHKSNSWKKNIFRSINDSEFRFNKRKTIEFDSNRRLTMSEQHEAPFRYAIPDVQIPITLEPDNENTLSKLNVPIDIDSNLSEHDWELKLGFVNYQGEDELEIFINQLPVDISDIHMNFDGWGRLEWTDFKNRLQWIKYPFAQIIIKNNGYLSKGSNTLELRLIKETVFKDNKVILKEIKLEL